MWRPWRKLSDKGSPRPPPSTSPSPCSIFRCSSFKDIETLCLDSDFPEDPRHINPNKYPPQPCTPRRSVFHRSCTTKALLRQWSSRSDTPTPTPKSPTLEVEDPPIVVYCTSLRVVRSTFESCRAVLSVFQGFRVAIDERDVAMDFTFMSELRERIGRKSTGDELKLPKVFIGGRYIGGADEVLQLNEIGELKKLVQGLPLASPGTCHTCGGYRFVLCAECSGSHKIFSEKAGFRSCLACNENGLIRCPHCSCPSQSHYHRSFFPHPNAS